MSGGRHRHDDRQMTLRDHVQELTHRFLLLVSVLLVASTLVYVYRAAVIPMLLQPLSLTFGDQKLMYLNPGGGFNFIFLISIYAGIAATIPLLIQQVYAFIRPTLPKSAQKLSAKLLTASFLLMIAGILFGYYIAVPGALKFLIDFAGEYVSAALTADSYLNFLIAYTVGLGLLFQIPFVIIIGNYIKPFTPAGLMKSERWAIVLTFIAAALITPTPDPINLMIVAIPILFVYQIGIVVVLLSMYKEKRKRRHRTRVVEMSVGTLARPVAQETVLSSHQPTITVNDASTIPMRRTIDGFARARVTPTVKIPARTNSVGQQRQHSMRPVIARVNHNAPYRYIDGVSIMVSQ